MTTDPTPGPHALLWQRLGLTGRNLEIGDAIILVYIAAFVRQYLWIINSNSLDWVLTILVSVLVWFVHLRTKEHSTESTPFQFWLVVALPLFVIYAMRAAFPDTSFDVLDYRLISSERALRGLPFMAGDFFPSRFPFNPVPDMVTGISRHLLGYRLGTIINYLVVLWVGSILNRLLRPYIKGAWLRCAGVLLLLLTEHVLFVINNYMVDLLALPLLLEAARLSFTTRTSGHSNAAVRIALFLSASVAFKLTNLAFAAPILLVYAYNVLRVQPRPQLARNGLLLSVAFAAPLLPFTLFISRQTGNPVFPMYNKIFRSAYWPAGDFVGVRWSPVVDDPRWLNMSWWEQLLWPILLPFKLEHTAGDLGPHAGRLSLCFIAALIGLVLTKDTAIRSLSFITLFGAILWSLISGMPRYATFLEVAGGVIVIYLVSLLGATRVSEKLRLFKRAALGLILSVLVLQSASACFYVYRFEWGSRPSFFENPKAYVRDSKYFLRDYSLPSFLPERERALINPVQVWAESNALESGIETLLKKDTPALCLYMPEFFSTDVSRSRFAQTLAGMGGKNFFSLTFSDHLEGSVSNLRRAGLGVGRITPVVIPYYSEHTRIHMALIEVLPSESQGGQFSITHTGAALPDEAFRAEINWSQPLPSFRTGLKETVYVKIRNVSEAIWPALGLGDGRYRLSLGNHWLDDQRTVVNDDGRSPLLFDLRPGDEIELPLTITAPQHEGDYVLEIDMVQEAVSWFGNRGSKTLRSRVRVTR